MDDDEPHDLLILDPADIATDARRYAAEVILRSALHPVTINEKPVRFSLCSDQPRQQSSTEGQARILARY